jgi:hypothetical protein
MHVGVAGEAAHEMAPASVGEGEKESDSPLGAAAKVYENVIYSPRSQLGLSRGDDDDDGDDGSERARRRERVERVEPRLQKKRAAPSPPSPTRTPEPHGARSCARIAFTPAGAPQR